MSRSIFKAEIRLGVLMHIIAAIIMIIDISFAAVVIMLLLEKKYPAALLFSVPVAALSVYTFKLLKIAIIRFLGKEYHEFELLDSGVYVGDVFLQWHKIKSISFQTGRLIHDRDFSRGFKLPAVQKIFVLDKNGEECSCMIDIDYWMKTGRENNNIRHLNVLFSDLGKISLISDWAEKRQ